MRGGTIMPTNTFAFSSMASNVEALDAIQILSGLASWT